VLDPAFAPEVTTPRVGGLSLYAVADLLDVAVNRLNVLAIDFVEVSSFGTEYNQAAHCAAALVSRFVIAHWEKSLAIH
jgi:arginase family enzyme